MLKYRLVISANTGMREVAQHLRIARSKAIRENRNVLFRFFRSPSDPLNWYTRYGYCDEGELAGPGTALINCAGFMVERQLPSGVVFRKTWAGGSSLPRIPGFFNGEQWANIGRSGGSGYGNGEIRQFMFFPNGAASHNVVVFIAPEADVGKTLERARAVTVRALSGSVRAWKFASGWN